MARLAGMRWREWLKYAGENGWFYSSANMLLRDMPEARPYLETRKSRFDGMA